MCGTAKSDLRAFRPRNDRIIENNAFWSRMSIINTMRIIGLAAIDRTRTLSHAHNNNIIIKSTRRNSYNRYTQSRRWRMVACIGMLWRRKQFGKQRLIIIYTDIHIYDDYTIVLLNTDMIYIYVMYTASLGFQEFVGCKTRAGTARHI